MLNRWAWIIRNAVLDVVSSGIHTHSDDFHISNRPYPFHIMRYVKEGCAEATVGGQTYTHHAGQLLIIPPHVQHDQYVPHSGAKTVFLWWHFTLTVGGVVDLIHMIKPSAVINISNAPAFENAFSQYIQLSRHTVSVADVVLLRAKGLEVMSYLIESMPGRTEEKNPLLMQIPDSFFSIFKRIIDQPEENLSLEELSKQYYMNATYISNRFKKLFGIAPIKLQHELLLERARNLLDNENRPMTNIAQELGFSDLSSFTRFFSSREGVTPSRYKEVRSMQHSYQASWKTSGY